MLVSDLQALRSGGIPRAEARTRTQIARAIIDTLKIEIVSHTLNKAGFTPVGFDIPPEKFISVELEEEQ
jgi:hypothetical protein